MAIFNSYVKLPEGMDDEFLDFPFIKDDEFLLPGSPEDTSDTFLLVKIFRCLVSKHFFDTKKIRDGQRGPVKHWQCSLQDMASGFPLAVGVVSRLRTRIRLQFA